MSAKVIVVILLFVGLAHGFLLAYFGTHRIKPPAYLEEIGATCLIIGAYAFTVLAGFLFSLVIGHYVLRLDILK